MLSSDLVTGQLFHIGLGPVEYMSVNLPIVVS
jgi:hypothetical protein